MKRQELNLNALAENEGGPADRVTIDHRFFAHIIDLIFSSLSYPGLVVCSKVCKEWRAKARARLFNHVAIFEDTSRNSTVVRSRDVGWPKESIVLITTTSTSTGALPQVAGSEVVDSHYRGFEHGTLFGFIPGWSKAFHRLLSSDNTADNTPQRRREDSLSGKLGWTDVVHFVDYSEGSFVIAPDCPRNPTTLALSIDCYSDPTARQEEVTSANPCAFSNLCFDSVNVKNFTMIFKDCRGQVFTSSMSWAASRGEIDIVHCQHPRLGAASELLLMIADHYHIESITIVGLDAFVADENRFPYLRDICKVVSRRGGPSGEHDVVDGVPCFEGYLQFYSHNQYRERVGEERYRLLTVR